MSRVTMVRDVCPLPDQFEKVSQQGLFEDDEERLSDTQGHTDQPIGMCLDGA